MKGVVSCLLNKYANLSMVLFMFIIITITVLWWPTFYRLFQICPDDNRISMKLLCGLLNVTIIVFVMTLISSVVSLILRAIICINLFRETSSEKINHDDNIPINIA